MKQNFTAYITLGRLVILIFHSLFYIELFYSPVIWKLHSLYYVHGIIFGSLVILKLHLLCGTTLNYFRQPLSSILHCLHVVVVHFGLCCSDNTTLFAGKNGMFSTYWSQTGGTGCFCYSFFFYILVHIKNYILYIKLF